MKDNKILVLGIDSSKRKTGVCIIAYSKVDGKDVYEIVEKALIKVPAIPNEPIFYSEYKSYLLLQEFLKKYVNDLDYSALEGFAFGGQGLTKLASTAAVYQLYLCQINKVITHIAPTRVKLIVGGSGKATKEEVRKGLDTFIPNASSLKWPSYDVSDAAAIAVASIYVNINPDKFPPTKKKVIKRKLKKESDE